MAAEDYLPFDFFDDDTGAFMTCTGCGREIVWDQLPDDRWQKFTESGRAHRCPADRAKASEFPLEPK